MLSGAPERVTTLESGSGAAANRFLRPDSRETFEGRLEGADEDAMKFPTN